MSALDNIPSNVKYYLLEWKDRNLEFFIKQYNNRKLRELSKQELLNLFSYAQNSDYELMDSDSDTPSRLYRLMIYFAHSTMCIYSKDTVEKKGMTVSEFMERNKPLLDRVCEEAKSIMNYELSMEQLAKASHTYLCSMYHPTSVYDTEAFTLQVSRK